MSFILDFNVDFCSYLGDIKINCYYGKTLQMRDNQVFVPTIINARSHAYPRTTKLFHGNLLKVC
jgi:hypothetical protein